MNVLQLSRTMGQGGAEKVVYQICSIKEKNLNFFVASTGGFYVKELNKKGVKHFDIPDIASKNPLEMIKIFNSLKKIVREYKIDVVHSHHRMGAFYAQIISRSCNVKLAYTAHNIRNDKKKLMRFSLKNTKIIAVGDSVRDNLENYYRLNADYIRVIKNTVPIKKKGTTDKKLQKLKKEGHTLVGNICRISEEKGVDVFIKAFTHIKDSKISGIIIGDGDEKQKMEILAKLLDVENKVIFLGFREDVIDLISQLDFVVLSSHKEGFPLTPVEVFSQKKLMIASDIPGNNEIVKDGITGLLFEDNDDDELSSKIQAAIKDKKMRSQIESNAFKTYQEEYKYSLFEKSYKTFYNELEVEE